MGSRPQGLQGRPKERVAGAGEAGGFSIREDGPRRPQAGARRKAPGAEALGAREPETPAPRAG